MNYEIEINGYVSKSRRGFFVYNEKCSTVLNCLRVVFEIPNLPGAFTPFGANRRFDVRIYEISERTDVRKLAEMFSIPATGMRRLFVGCFIFKAPGRLANNIMGKFL